MAASINSSNMRANTLVSVHINGCSGPTSTTTMLRNKYIVSQHFLSFTQVTLIFLDKQVENNVCLDGTSNCEWINTLKV